MYYWIFKFVDPYVRAVYQEEEKEKSQSLGNKIMSNLTCDLDIGLDDNSLEDASYKVLYALKSDVINFSNRGHISNIIDDELRGSGIKFSGAEDKLRELQSHFSADELEVEWKTTKTFYKKGYTQDFISYKIRIKERKNAEFILGVLLLYNMISETTKELLFPYRVKS